THPLRWGKEHPQGTVRAVAADSFEPGRASVSGEQTVRQGAIGADLPPTGEMPQVSTGADWTDEGADAGGGEETPRRRFRGAGCLFWLAGLLALILVVGIGLKVTGLLPHFSNPFAERKTD